MKDTKARKLIEEILYETGAIEDVPRNVFSFRKRITDLEEDNARLRSELQKFRNDFEEVINLIGVTREKYIDDGVIGGIKYHADEIKTRFIKANKLKK